MPSGLVLDGELLVLNSDGVMDFGALQRRAAATAPRTVRTLARAYPAYLVAFDVLQVDGRSIMAAPWERRRALLESLFADHALAPPWTPCPSTRDLAVAREWLATAAPGAHPWQGARFSPGWGRGGEVLDMTLVAPERVAEVSVDTAQNRGVWRHPVRLVRLRLDMPPDDVETFRA
ncbi:ATP-dependent DNA ligase [Streptomyces californicus]